MHNDIMSTVKSYILSEYLPGEDPNELTESTPLIKGGILDSIAVVRVVTFLEEKFNIELKPDEVIVENLNTISGMANLIQRKLKETQE
ncbi:MAG: acyl carrier protein [Acidobacteria bacterium]|nr:MAG: acyl carrier protein [Acidobacteriota bacterium]